MTTSRSRSAFTLVELLVVIAIIGVLIAMLLPAVQAAREAARRSSCTNNVKQVALAFQLYHDSFKRFPLGGNEGPSACCSADPGVTWNYSWAFHILPFIEQANAYEQGNPNFGQLQQTLVEPFYCPTRRTVRLYKGDGKCDYAANGGRSGSTQDGVVNRSDRNTVRIRDITDGTSNTMMLMETRVHLSYIESGGCCGDNEDAFTYGWGDDNVRFVGKPPERDVATTSLPDSIVDNQFGGSHTGVSVSAAADGSVRGVSFNVDFTVFRRYGTRNEGEPFNTDSL